MNLKLRELRKAKGLNQSELAEMVDVTTRVMGAWERRDTQITLEDACRVCLALDCTPNDLCGWYDEHPEDRPQGAQEAARVTRDESALLANYRASPPEGRATIESVARMSCGQREEDRSTCVEEGAA